MTSLRKAPFGVGLMFVVLITRGARGGADDGQFRKEVLVCEEALARISACCPGVDGDAVVCDFRHESTGGCGEGTRDNVDPALSVAESECVIQTSCEKLNSDGVCARVKEARPYVTKIRFGASGERIDEGSVTHPPVCP